MGTRIYVCIYIHTWVFKQECTGQDYIRTYLGFCLTIKIASECVLKSITVKFLLEEKYRVHFVYAV